MKEKGCYEYTIEARDIDFVGKATFVSLCNYILQAAGEDADLNGFGVRDLNCDNCSWVLSRMAVESTAPLAQYDKFTVKTWVNEVGRMMTTRNMKLYGDDDRPIGAAVTQWAIIDLDKRTPLDIREHVDYEGSVVEIPSPIVKPARVVRVAPTETTKHKVVYSDIDFNCHVNSMKYIEWMLDMVPLDVIETRNLRRADINFLHESRHGQTLEIGLEHGEKSLFEIKNEEGAPLCRASFVWD